MFPHTITIYRHSIENGADVYSRQVVKGVYWYGGQGISQNGKGATEETPVTVITSPETANQYGSGWTIEPKDRIMKGDHPDITSFRDIPAAPNVVGVEDNRCGSTVDNITITAK